MGLAYYFVFTLIALTATVLLLNPKLLHLPLIGGKDGFLEGLRRVRIWHLAIAAAVMTLAFAFLDPGAVRSGIPQFVAMAVVLVLFAVAWVREFLFLMSLRDED